MKCKDCGKELIWDESQKTRQGKWIPIDKETNKPHYCPNQTVLCNNCNAEFRWAIAPNGEPRPYINGKIHDCRDWWEEDGELSIVKEIAEEEAYEEWKTAEEERIAKARRGIPEFEDDEIMCSNCGEYGHESIQCPVGDGQSDYTDHPVEPKDR